MCKRCMDGMSNSLNTDVTDRHGNKLKRSKCHIIEYMTKPKTKRIIDFGTCHHDTNEGFQEGRDFTYLKKLYRDGLQKSGNASSLLEKNCMACSTPLLPVHEGGDVN